MTDEIKSDIEKTENTSNFDAHKVIVVWLFLATFILVFFKSITLFYSDLSGDKVITTLVIVTLCLFSDRDYLDVTLFTLTS